MAEGLSRQSQQQHLGAVAYARPGHARPGQAQPPVGNRRFSSESLVPFGVAKCDFRLKVPRNHAAVFSEWRIRLSNQDFQAPAELLSPSITPQLSFVLVGLCEASDPQTYAQVCSSTYHLSRSTTEPIFPRHGCVCLSVCLVLRWDSLSLFGDAEISSAVPYERGRSDTASPQRIGSSELASAASFCQAEENHVILAPPPTSVCRLRSLIRGCIADMDQHAPSTNGIGMSRTCPCFQDQGGSASAANRENKTPAAMVADAKQQSQVS